MIRSPSEEVCTLESFCCLIIVLLFIISFVECNNFDWLRQVTWLTDISVINGQIQ